MMVPGSVSATLGNARRGNLDLRIALCVGIAACVTSPLGIVMANSISPLWSNIAFSLLLLAVGTRLIVKHRKARRARR
nr:TSUP family transporter [Agromyces subbeticus]